MSNDEYQQQNYWTDHNICIEKDKDGKCLVSAKYVFLDVNDIKHEPQLFCQQVKINNYDQTI